MAETLFKDRKELLKAYRASGQTQKQWCKTNNVSIHTLRYWLGKDRQTTEIHSENKQWVTLQVQDEAVSPTSQAIYIQLANMSIAVHPGFDPKHLLTLLRTLTEL